LSLLSDYTSGVRTLLEKADGLRRDGQLAPAVQAYLEVLETDPANAEARAALGPVLRALRAPRSSRGDILILLTGAVIAAAAFAAGYWWVH
jgi:Flp pilus assembly protein TadD